jgi:drug/metabolite transporter (DMT)-like permease
VTPAAQAWGIAAAAVYAVGYLATAMLSLRRIRQGKRAWWLPLVGAIVTTLIAGICVWIPLMADPAVASYFQQMTG